jgi:SOS-response transcriptional repressor LexA
VSEEVVSLPRKVKPLRGPTDRQIDVLRFIASVDVPPSVREIAAAIGVTGTNGVAQHLVFLEKKGLIQRGQVRSRHIVVTDAGYKILGFRRPTVESARAAGEAWERGDLNLSLTIIREMARCAPRTSRPSGDAK